MTPAKNLPKKKLLLSGFEPFAGDAINPTAELMFYISQMQLAVDQKITDQQIAANAELFISAFQIRTCVLPVVFGRAFEVLKIQIQEFRPDFVVSLGYASNRSKVSVEKVAINYVNARIADNENQMPQEQKILQNAPAAYFSTLPVDQMLNAAAEDAEVSLSAGSYVCNDLMFRLLHHTRMSCTQSGFIHVPLNIGSERLFSVLNRLLLPLHGQRQESLQGLQL